MKNSLVKVNKVCIEHEDNRRTLKKIFNGEFVAKQLLVLETKKDCILGGHYHEYDEIFYVLKGRVAYKLINVDTRKMKRIILSEGDKIKIPRRTYHEAKVSRDTIIIGATEEQYISAEKNNLNF